MTADWDYARLSKTASQGGGPQAYLNAIKQGSREQGRIEGGITGVALTFAFGVTVYFGPKAYRSIKSLKAKRQAAASAEATMLEGVGNPSDSDVDDVPPTESDETE